MSAIRPIDQEEAAPVRTEAARSRRSGAPPWLFTAVAGVLLIADASAALLIRAPAMPVDSALRVVTAGVLVLLVPGMAWGQILGVRARHAFEALAKAVGVSLVIDLALALAAFALRVSIGAWAAGLLGVNAAGLILTLRPGGRGRLGLLRDLTDGVWRNPGAVLGLGAGIALIARGLYRWADDPTAVGWEVGVQLSYVRQYASGLPLDPRLCALRPEPAMLLPNVFFLWEFLLAGISRLSAVEPLVAALRSRWIIPAFGLPAFFSMVLHLFGSVRLAERALGIVLVASLSGLLFLDPSPLVAAGISTPTRGVTAFWGSIHHADAAMEILLPLQIAALFQFLASGRRRHLAWLASALVIGFFWHPREYFQMMWYGAIAVATTLLGWSTLSERRPRWGRLAALVGTFAVIAAGLAFVTAHMLPRNQTIQDQLAAKRTLAGLLTEPTVLFGAYPPFNAPFHGFGQAMPAHPYVYSWMVLAALLMAPVMISGRRSAWLVAFYAILWFATICWFWSQVLLILLTYSEILFSSMRFLHLFALAVIGAGFVAALRLWHVFVPTRLPHIANRVGLLCASGLAGGVFILTWKSLAPQFTGLSPVVSGIALLTAVAAMAALRGRLSFFKWRRDPSDAGVRPTPGLAMTVAAFTAFVAPAWASGHGSLIRDLAIRQTEPTSLFEAGNPFGFSPQLIRFLRERLPPREMVAIDPLGRHFASVYAPVYVRPYPIGYIIPDIPEVSQARDGHHPLFNGRLRRGALDPAQAEDYLGRIGARWVIAEGRYAHGLRRLAKARPDVFQVAFESDVGEVVLRADRRARGLP